MEKKLSKRCTKCGNIKPLSDFNKQSSTKDGLSYMCRECHKQSILEYGRTKVGLIHQLYRHQKANSNRRNHDLPSYSSKELIEWVLSHPNFDELYNNWVESGYKKKLKPSIDRLNNDIGYTFNNIQLVTWEENFNNWCNRNEK